MISIDYVNGTCSCVMDILARPFEEYYETCMDDFYSGIGDSMAILEAADLEYDIFQEKTTQPATIAAKKSGIFERIGQTIISLYEKFIALVGKVMDTIKGISFKNKSQVQRMELLIKKHPELKNEVIMSVDAGLLNLNDFKSLNELERAFDNIMKMDNADPGTLEAKWKAAKRKFEKANESWLIKGAAAATTILTCAVLAATFGPKIKEAWNKMRDAQANANKRRAEHARTLKNKQGKEWDKSGGFTKKLEIEREMIGLQAKTIKEHGKMLENLQTGMARFLDKHAPKLSEKENARINADVDNLNAWDEKREAEKKRKEDEEQEREKSRAHELWKQKELLNGISRANAEAARRARASGKADGGGKGKNGKKKK